LLHVHDHPIGAPLTRRRWLQVGGIGLFGLALPRLLQADGTPRPSQPNPRARWSGRRPHPGPVRPLRRLPRRRPLRAAGPCCQHSARARREPNAGGARRLGARRPAQHGGGSRRAIWRVNPWSTGNAAGPKARSIRWARNVLDLDATGLTLMRHSTPRSKFAAWPPGTGCPPRTARQRSTTISGV
jgi:hypothetical protein